MQELTIATWTCTAGPHWLVLLTVSITGIGELGISALRSFLQRLQAGLWSAVAAAGGQNFRLDRHAAQTRAFDSPK